MTKPAFLRGWACWGCMVMVISIVGSRSPVGSVGPVVARVVGAFARRGWLVASGGALGVDSLALSSLLALGFGWLGVVFSAWSSLAGFPRAVRPLVSRPCCRLAVGLSGARLLRVLLGGLSWLGSGVVTLRWFLLARLWWRSWVRALAGRLAWFGLLFVVVFLFGFFCVVARFLFCLVALGSLFDLACLPVAFVGFRVLIWIYLISLIQSYLVLFLVKKN